MRNFRGYDPITINLDAGGSWTQPEPMGMGRGEGIIGSELVITGDGEVAVDILGSFSGTNFRMGEGKTAMAAGLSAASGEEEDGVVLIESNQECMPVASETKLRLRETGGAAVTVVLYVGAR
ncbi:hypothetical protein Dalk_3543 [Desulfatibacillum aliphaticivorans]|uniref:Uncharacterized protein n=1 Tax=Desulfatibacillum aliphaticivorans TaxID=218208 RepID=B8FC26_DESAL|nr:hypothetical protein [Desulfatibacillum aliphaticivorans]ACL05231.1 hypothetical protein Dalk_3543 [Desulfatibacillum aliphaticivorans]